MELPTPTRDIALAKRQLDVFGYCLIRDALPLARLGAVRERLVSQAAAEAECGAATFDAGPNGSGVNQRLWFLVNKGQEFRDLVCDAGTRPLVAHLLGEEFLLSAMTANIARAGGQEGWHVDQWWLPGPVAPDGADADRIRAGSITKARFRNRFFVDEPNAASAPAMISPVVACNTMWMISDYTELNGATRVVPGSHRWGKLPHATDNPNIRPVPVVGPAGTAAIFEARIWHTTGASIATEDRLGIFSYFCAPQFRQQENQLLGLDDTVLANASDELKALLGLKPFNGYGRIGAPGTNLHAPTDRALGELTPTKSTDTERYN